MTNLLVFFFFQAEDGIRDLYVTGVQTCALPIYFGKREPDDVRRLLAAGSFEDLAELARRVSSRILLAARLEILRSEERRVGKECRSRWSAYHEKKNREYIRRDDFIKI